MVFHQLSRKNASHLLILLFLSLVTLSCSTDDDNLEKDPVEIVDEDSDGNGDSDPETEDNLFRLDIEGLEGLNYEDLEVLSVTGSASVDEQGEFENLSEPNEEVDLPLLFVENDEVLFGVFPKAVQGGNVTVDDILLYYLSLHPEISFLRMEQSELMTGIKSLSDKESFEAELLESLDANQNPLNNPAFLEIYNQSAASIAGAVSKRAMTKEYIQDFAIEYKRNGHIIFPTEVPLFAAVGVEIENISTGDFLVRDYMMKRKSLLLDGGSYGAWLMNQLFPEAAPPEYKTFNLSEAGTYEIRFTNGAGSGPLSEAVIAENRMNFISTTLAFAAPIALEKILKMDKCPDIINKARVGLAAEFAKYSVSPPSKEDLIALTVNTSISLAGDVAKCAFDANTEKYLGLLLSASNQIVSKAKTISELLFFARDFFVSDIQGLEQRYYDNGVSFGELELSNESGYEFFGNEKDEFLYEATITEEVISYEVHRDVTAEFKPKMTKEPANQLPFEVQLLSGDVKIGSAEEVTHNGTLFANFTMGKEKSRVEITPAFKTTNISAEIVKLEPVNPLIGTWKPKTYRGEPLGTPLYVYMDECPEILKFIDYLHDQTLTFYEDTYLMISDEQYIAANITVNSSCQVTADSEDYDRRESSSLSGTYSFEDNILTMQDNDDNADNKPNTVAVEFVNQEKTRFILSNDSYKDIWEKQ